MRQVVVKQIVVKGKEKKPNNMATNKLLYPFAYVMGLFFPVGRLENGGTCEFATEKCCIECYACVLDTDMGIEVAMKQKIYNYFLNSPQDTITKQILIELEEAKCDIFTWFASGDCPSFLTEKFFAIIKDLDDAKIIQTGFTRNKDLWKKCKSLSDNNKTLLTIEDAKEAAEAGLYSIPNYEIGAVDIYQICFEQVYKISGCGGGYYVDHIKKMGKDNSHLKLDCNACFENKTGCFKIFK